MIRCQLPAYSPLSSGRLLGAAMRAAVTSSSEQRLRDLLEDRFEAGAVVLTSSGTHALQTALSLAASTAPWAGRPVALPAYTCYDVATAAVGADVRVSFYDIDPASLCPDPEGVRRALASGAGVVVANSLYGFPLDWDWLRTECEAAGALLVEDAAQGLGSAWRDRDGGCFGDLTVLSFGRGKGWTGGGGGALLLRSRFMRAAEDALPLRLDRPGALGNGRALAVSLAQWALSRPFLFRLPASLPMLALGETHYKKPTAPMGMGAFPAAAACAHDEAARAEMRYRRSRAVALLDGLGESRTAPSYDLPRPIAGGACGFLRLPVVARGVGVRDALLVEGRCLGIARGYPRPLPSLPPLVDLRADPELPLIPGATELADRLVSLPTHSLVNARDQMRLCSLLSGTA